MLARLPRQLPLILDDLGRPSTADLAAALGVTERTARRWIAADTAPRAALLGLYCLTRWGVSQIHADAYNLAQLHQGAARCAADELTRLRALLARLTHLGAWRCTRQAHRQCAPRRARRRARAEGLISQAN